jgi:predicted nucleic-acid-binding protein
MTSQPMTASIYRELSITVYKQNIRSEYTEKMQSFYSDILRENSVYIAGVVLVGLVYVLYSVCFHGLRRPRTS